MLRLLPHKIVVKAQVLGRNAVGVGMGPGKELGLVPTFILGFNRVVDSLNSLEV